MVGMGYNVGLMHVDRGGVDDLARIGLVPTGATVTAEEVLGGVQPAAVSTFQGVLLLDPAMEHVADDEGVAATLGRRVVTALVGSTGDTFSVSVRDGGLVRHRVDSQGERVVDEGDPLRGEPAEMMDDLAALELFDTVAGTDVAGPDFWETPCRLLGPGAPPARGILGRIFGR